MAVKADLNAFEKNQDIAVIDTARKMRGASTISCLEPWLLLGDGILREGCLNFSVALRST